MRTRAVVAPLVLAAVAAAAACSQGAVPALSADDVVARYGYRVADATLSPVYALVPGFKDPSDLYARDLLIQDCLKGVVQYTPKSPDSRWDGADPRTGQWTLDEATAQKSGYPYLRERPAEAAEGIPADVEVTDALQKTMASCAAKANERVGKVPERLLNDIENAGWDALDGAAEMEQVIADWHTCMAPVGLVDLPAHPQDMPPASVVARPVQVDSPGSPLTDRERTVAVADATCRTQVDYYGVELRLRVQGELAAIAANLNEFEAARADYQEHQKRVDAVLAELG